MVLSQKIREEQDYTFFQTLFDLNFIKIDKPLKNAIQEEILVLQKRNWTNSQIYISISYILSECILNRQHFVNAQEFKLITDNLKKENKLENPISKPEFNEYIKDKLSKPFNEKRKIRLKNLQESVEKNTLEIKKEDENTISPLNKKFLDKFTMRSPTGLLIPTLNIKRINLKEKIDISQQEINAWKKKNNSSGKQLNAETWVEFLISKGYTITGKIKEGIIYVFDNFLEVNKETHLHTKSASVLIKSILKNKGFLFLHKLGEKPLQKSIKIEENICLEKTSDPYSFGEVYELPNYIDNINDTTLLFHTAPLPNIKPDMQFDKVYITSYAITSENKNDSNYYRNYGFSKFKGNNKSAVGMNGTGKLKSGNYLKYTGNVYNKPYTSTGTIPVPLRTLAVPQGVIPYGSYIYIDGAKDVRLNGWYIAEDTGSKITYGDGLLRLDFFAGESYSLYELAVTNLQNNKGIKVYVYNEFPYPNLLPRNENKIAEQAKKTKTYQKPLYYAGAFEETTGTSNLQVKKQKELRKIPSTDNSLSTNHIPNFNELYAKGFKQIEGKMVKTDTEAYKYNNEWVSRVVLEYNGKYYDTLIPNPLYNSSALNPSGIAYFAFNSKEEWIKHIENSGGKFSQYYSAK